MYVAAFEMSWTSDAKKLLTQVRKLADADPFLQPVDWKGFGLTDYPDIIKNPMDVSTMGAKLSSNQYDAFAGFLADFSLIISNCKLYNAEGSDVFEMAVRLEGEWDKLVKSLRNWKDDAKKILINLKKNSNAIWFLEPVDWKGLGLKDYPDIIKSPMDLGTVGTKLAGTEYENLDQFWSDVYLVWSNCMKYNADGSEVYLMALAMKDECDRIRGSIAPVASAPAAPAGGRKRKSAAPQSADEDGDDMMDEAAEDRREDMTRLGRRLAMLEHDYLVGAVKFIYGKCPAALKAISGEPGSFDVDLETLMKSDSASSINQLIKVMLFLQQNPMDE